MRRIRCKRQLPLPAANRQKSERDVFSHLMHILFQLQLLRCKRVELFFAVCDVPTFERIVILSTVGAIECGGNRGRERQGRLMSTGIRFPDGRLLIGCQCPFQDATLEFSARRGQGNCTRTVDHIGIRARKSAKNAWELRASKPHIDQLKRR